MTEASTKTVETLARPDTITVFHPFDGRPVGAVTRTSEADVRAAVEKARLAWQDFRDSTPGERRALLYRLADAIAADAEGMARSISLEMGKTIHEARRETQRAQNTLKLSGDAATFLDGEVLNCAVIEGASHKMASVTYEPVGVVAAITPFNYPLNLLCHKLGPAIGAGNTVVAKPSSTSPLSTERLAGLARDVGFPDGLFQVVYGSAPVAQALARAPIDILSFTGGPKAGQALKSASGLIRCLMELGGNDPLIVMPDADLEKAVDTVVAQRFEIAGQSCAAVKRLYLHEDIRASVIERLLERVAAMRVGDPLDEATDMGSVIDEDAAEWVVGRIDDAVARGARLLTGGGRKGTLVEPTVVDGVPVEAPLIAEETFGPVVSIRGFTDADAVVAEVNAGPYGLQAGLFTNDNALIRRIARTLQVGGVMINEGPDFRAEHVPFGGVKQSGLGREGVRMAIREMSETKVVIE